MGNCLWISIASFRPHLCKNGKVKRNHSRNGIWHTTCCRLQSLTVQSISKFFPHPSTSRRWTLILCTRLDSTITGILLRTGLRCLFFLKKRGYNLERDTPKHLHEIFKPPPQTKKITFPHKVLYLFHLGTSWGNPLPSDRVASTPAPYSSSWCRGENAFPPSFSSCLDSSFFFSGGNPLCGSVSVSLWAVESVDPPAEALGNGYPSEQILSSFSSVRASPSQQQQQQQQRHSFC